MLLVLGFILIYSTSSQAIDANSGVEPLKPFSEVLQSHDSQRVPNLKESTRVIFYEHLESIRTISVEKRVYELRFEWSLQWIDPRLFRSNSSGERVVLHDTSAIWRPQMKVEQAILPLRTWNSVATVDANGTVVLIEKVAITVTAAAASLKFYPLRMTRLELRFGALGFSVADMDLESPINDWKPLLSPLYRREDYVLKDVEFAPRHVHDSDGRKAMVFDLKYEFYVTPRFLLFLRIAPPATLSLLAGFSLLLNSKSNQRTICLVMLCVATLGSMIIQCETKIDETMLIDIWSSISAGFVIVALIVTMIVTAIRDLFTKSAYKLVPTSQVDATHYQIKSGCLAKIDNILRVAYFLVLIAFNVYFWIYWTVQYKMEWNFVMTRSKIE